MGDRCLKHLICIVAVKETGSYHGFTMAHMVSIKLIDDAADRRLGHWLRVSVRSALLGRSRACRRN
jgi:hypothetical protein